eukprot:6172011-Pleurochrysis_carterae.AAC.2
MMCKWGHPVATLPVTNGTTRHTRSMTEILRITVHVGEAAAATAAAAVLRSAAPDIGLHETHLVPLRRVVGQPRATSSTRAYHAILRCLLLKTSAAGPWDPYAAETPKMKSSSFMMGSLMEDERQKHRPHPLVRRSGGNNDCNEARGEVLPIKEHVSLGQSAQERKRTSLPSSDKRAEFS